MIQTCNAGMRSINAVKKAVVGVTTAGIRNKEELNENCYTVG